MTKLGAVDEGLPASMGVSEWAKIIAVALYLLMAQIVSDLHSPIGIAVCMALAAVVTLSLSRYETLAFMLVLTASNRLLTLGPISVLSIVAIAYIIKFIIFSKKASSLGRNFILLSLSLLLFSCVQAGIELSFSPIFSNVKIIIILIAIVDMFNHAIGFETLCNLNRFFAFGIIIGALWSLLLDPSSLKESTRFTLGNESGQNVLGIACAFSLTVFVSVILRRGFSFTDLLMGVLLLSIGLMTGSRSFVLGAAIGVIVAAIGAISKISFKVFARLILGLLLVLIFGYTVISNIPYILNYLTVAIERIVNPKNGDISNMRFDIWQQYIEVFEANPLFLLFGTSDLKRYALDIVAHNCVIEQLASHGVLGSLIVVPLYIISLRSVCREIAKTGMLGTSIASTAPLMVLFAASMFSHTLLGIPQTTMLFFGISFAATSIKETNLKEGEMHEDSIRVCAGAANCGEQGRRA